MKTLQELCGSNFLKVIGKGILGKQRDEMKRRIFNASSKREGIFFGHEREAK
jgi:hypothetical protein